MPTILKDLEITKIALVDEGSCSEAYIKFAKNKPKGEKVMNYEEILKSLTEEQQEIIIAKMKEQEDLVQAKDTELSKTKEDLAEAKEVIKAKEDMETDKEDKEEDEEDTLMKSMPKAVQELVAKAKLQEKLALDELKKSKDAEENRVALEKAKTLKNLPVEESELATIVKGADAKVLELLEKANSALENSELFKEKGSTGYQANNTVSEDSAWEEIEKAAEPVALAKSISKEKAISLVIKEKPDLYQKYLDALN